MTIKKSPSIVIIMSMLIGHTHAASVVNPLHESVAQAAQGSSYDDLNAQCLALIADLANCPADDQTKKDNLNSQLAIVLAKLDQSSKEPGAKPLVEPIIEPIAAPDAKPDLQADLAIRKEKEAAHAAAITKLTRNVESSTREFKLFFSQALTPSLFNDAQKNSIQEIQTEWDIKIESISVILSELKQPALTDAKKASALQNVTDRIAQISDYVQHLKQTHFILQFFTINKDELNIQGADLALKKPITTMDYQHMLLNVLRDLDDCDSQFECMLQTIESDLAYYDSSFDEDNNSLRYMLKAYETLGENAHDYVHITAQYNSLHYSHDNKAYTSLSSHVDELLKKLLIQRKQSNAPESDTAKIMLDSMIAKLAGLKQKIALRQQLEQLAKHGQQTIAIFNQHTSLINTPLFKTLQQSAQKTITAYLIVTEEYFNNASHSPMFLHDVQNVTRQLQQLKAAASRSIFMRCFRGQHVRVALLEGLEDVLLQIDAQVKATQDQGLGGIINNILSGDWLKQSGLTGIKSKDGIFSLEFANQLMSGQHKDLKTAALCALAYAAPTIISKILSLLRPFFDKNLDTKIGAALESPMSGDKMIELLIRNPEIFNKLTSTHPELLDTLASRVQHLVKNS